MSDTQQFDVQLLELDKPTQATGNIYTKAALKKWLKKNGPQPPIFYGEYGQARASDAMITGNREGGMTVDAERICVKIIKPRLEGNFFVGTAIPHPPMGEEMLKHGPTPQFAVRALVNTRKVGEELHRDIVDVIAFDFVNDSTTSPGEEE